MSQAKIFVLIKDAVYQHGVFWIGEDLEEGKRKADRAASLDTDDHHKWKLCEFVEPVRYTTDANHAVVYTGVRTYANN